MAFFTYIKLFQLFELLLFNFQQREKSFAADIIEIYFISSYKASIFITRSSLSELNNRSHYRLLYFRLL